MHKRENTFMYHDGLCRGRVWEFPIGPVDPWDEAIETDRELFPRFHIHISQTSRDCDGMHGSYYSIRPAGRDNFTAEDVSHYVARERAAMVGTFSLEKFWKSAIHAMIDCTPDFGGTLEIGVNDDDRYDRWAEWSQRTDEGGRSESIRLCVDDCDDEHTVYDQYAEMEGY
jgi:hypothetical protein